MLTELRIQDYAVIHSLSLRLGSGLNALTGETGAGKSIVVGALSLLLGARASADVVRVGADRAVVEGVFDIERNLPARALLGAYGLEEEEGLVIVRREIAAGGRGRVWINGSAGTAALLGELGACLVDLHGQHDHQSLLRPRQQRAVLDAYAGALESSARVQAAHTRLQTARTQLRGLETRARETEQRADFLRFQLEEIERAKLRRGEEESIELEARRLSHASELAQLAESLHADLYAGEDALGARLAEIRRTLDQLIRIDDSLTSWREVVDNALFGLEELGRDMGRYANAIEHDPARLEELRRRQELLFRLKRKYGPELDDVIRTGESARAELAALDSSGLDRAALEREIGTAEHELARAANELSAARARAAGKLAEEVAAVLPELGMVGGRFVVELTRQREITAFGAEDVEFRIAVNPGFEPRPLARVASGGELSRVMLALKTVLARLDAIPTLVFDEIDAGIGGKVAHHVGEKLKRLAADHQVFVVTHLPQIASRADVHLLVQKSDAEGIATADVTTLTGEARVRELARLLGGDPDSNASLAHARELLAASC
jgi:DNA repair protein RecN (Recombination protein N)